MGLLGDVAALGRLLAVLGGLGDEVTNLLVFWVSWEGDILAWRWTEDDFMTL